MRGRGGRPPAQRRPGRMACTARGAPPSRPAASLGPPVSGQSHGLLPHRSSRSCGRRKGGRVSRPPHGHRSGAGLHPAHGTWRRVQGVSDEEGAPGGSAGLFPDPGQASAASSSADALTRGNPAPSWTGGHARSEAAVTQPGVTGVTGAGGGVALSPAPGPELLSGEVRTLHSGPASSNKPRTPRLSPPSRVPVVRTGRRVPPGSAEDTAVALMPPA